MKNIYTYDVIIGDVCSVRHGSREDARREKQEAKALGFENVKIVQSKYVLETKREVR